MQSRHLALAVADLLRGRGRQLSPFCSSAPSFLSFSVPRSSLRYQPCLVQNRTAPWSLKVFSDWFAACSAPKASTPREATATARSAVASPLHSRFAHCALPEWPAPETGGTARNAEVACSRAWRIEAKLPSGTFSSRKDAKASLAFLSDAALLFCSDSRIGILHGGTETHQGSSCAADLGLRS